MQWPSECDKVSSHMGVYHTLDWIHSYNRFTRTEVPGRGGSYPIMVCRSLVNTIARIHCHL